MQRYHYLPIFAVSFIMACSSITQASFHFMQIEQIIAGVNGDARAQAIQLRMRVNGQNLVDRGRLIVWDAHGANPVVLLDIPSDVASDTLGDRILFVTEEMSSYTDPPVSADFLLSVRIPDEYLAAGSITIESDEDMLIVWRISWGGSSYLGTTSGALTNDADGDFGPALDVPLPTTSLQAMQFTGAADAESINNFADYQITTDAAVLINNAGATFTVTNFQCANTLELDEDGDLLCGELDNCPTVSNADQADSDQDGTGDLCDLCPSDSAKTEPGICGCGEADTDTDEDGILDCNDNCPTISNTTQIDSDNNGIGDVCNQVVPIPAMCGVGMISCIFLCFLWMQVCRLHSRIQSRRTG